MKKQSTLDAIHKKPDSKNKIANRTIFHNRLKISTLVGVMLLLTFGLNARATTFFVKPGGSDTNTGNSWAVAFQTLQKAIETATAGDKIWVAAGTYLPTKDKTGSASPADPRTKTFFIDKDIKIYGGFIGTETLLSQRDFATNVTTLSGDIGTPNVNSDNAYHVVYMQGIPSTALLDGFTITAGNADGASSPFNLGGGIYNDGSSGLCSSSDPTIANCIFSGNSASNNGGAMFNNGLGVTSSPTLTNCTFSGNSAGGAGGAMANDGSSTGTSSPSLTNCSFSGNSASGGGAITNNGVSGTSNPLLTNCILWGNSSEIENLGGAAATVTFSIVQGGHAGTGNKDVDPLFVLQPDFNSAPTTAGDLHLQTGSPAIDAGTATGAPATDLDGNPRPIGGGFDMGAFESQFVCPAGTNLFVNQDAAGANDGTSWTDAFTDLQDAIDFACLCTNFQEIWVAAGTYLPTKDKTGSASPANARDKTFFIDKDIKIYGGFIGTETLLSQRDFATNVTTLSGDIGTPNDNSDNAYHVVSMERLSSTAVLDGFTITAGNADGASSPAKIGGGILNNGFCGIANATISNCTFSGNSASVDGGAVYNDGSGGGTSSPTLINCTFSGNSAGEAGGAMANDGSSSGTSSPTLTNCSFSGNSAGEGGGAIINFGTFSGTSSPTLTNCSFSGNSANGGGAMTNTGTSGTSNPLLTNCILWGNSSEIENLGGAAATITFSIVQGGHAGTGNKDVDPLFVMQPDFNSAPTTAGDLRLQACSPAIDAGSDAANTTTTDLAGNTRKFDAIPYGSKIDMGAYEFQSSIAPVASCQNQTVQLDPGGNASLAASLIDNGSTGCTPLSFSVDGQSTLNFSCADVGNNNVTLRVTDALQNVATCTATVTVLDMVVPNDVCQNITVQLDATGNASITADQIDGGSSDACGIASLNASKTNFDCTDVGPNTVILTVADNNGNLSKCFPIVTVEDMVAPIALCQNITVQLDATGNASINAAQIDGGSSDACGIATLSASKTHFNCTDVGANTVTLTVTDPNGNSSMCTATVTLEDMVAPIALCQDITVQLDATGNASINAAQIDGGSSDACGIATLSASKTSFDCTDVGANTVTLTVTDNHGNSSMCTATVTVEDIVVPVALCQNITIQLDATGNASINAAQIDDGSSDACGIATLSASKTSFDCTDVGANTVTLTVTDNNGKSNTCTATVTVEDKVVPMALCQNITVQLDGSGNTSITAAQIDGGSSDACGIATFSASKTNFDCTDVGDNTVTLTVIDNNGNSSICTATVTVKDLAPIAACQDITVQLDASGNASITASQIDGGSSDPCGIAALSASKTNFDCTDVGANTVTLTVTDNNGNSSMCTATVAVEDMLAPQALCRNSLSLNLFSAGSATLSPADIDIGSIDNCGIASMSLSQNLFSCADIGDHNVTLTVTDLSGNVATCSTAVTVLGNGSITSISVSNISACNDNGTPFDPSDDTFTADVTMTFANQPARGQLVLSGDGNAVIGAKGLNSTHTFSGVTMSADGSPIELSGAFSINTACPYTNPNAGIAPTPCSTPPPVCAITSISASNISACNGNGTPSNPADDFFTADVTVGFANAPAVGFLNLTGDGTASEAATNLGSAPTSHTFTGVQMSADGSPISLTASFSVNPNCTLTNSNAGIAPASCSTVPPACAITAISTANISACDDQGTPRNTTDDTFTADVTVAFANPPSSGILDLTGDGTASVSASGLAGSYTFTGVLMRADGSPIECTATFSSSPSCTLTNANTGTAPASCSTNRISSRSSRYDFKLYPNPAGHLVNIDLSQFMGLEIDLVVFNPLGQVFFKRHFQPLENELLAVDLESPKFRSGIYFVSLIRNGKVISKRLAVTRAGGKTIF